MKNNRHKLLSHEACTIDAKEYNEKMQPIWDAVTELMASNTLVRHFRFVDYFCGEQRYFGMKNNIAMYSDAGHLSMQGEKMLGNELIKSNDLWNIGLRELYSTSIKDD